MAVTDQVPTKWGLVASSILPIVVVLWLGAEMPNALGFAASLFAFAVTLHIAVSRAFAIAALDRAAEPYLSHFSCMHGTLTTAAVPSSMVATVTVIASVLLSAVGSGTIEALFVQVLGVAISTALLAYLLMFPSCLIPRYTYPALSRRYLVPGGIVGAWIVTLLPMLYCGIACYFLLIPSDRYLQNNHLDRLTFELAHFVPLFCIVVLTIVLSIWGHKQRQNRDVLVDLTVNTSRENYPLLSPKGNGISRYCRV